MRKLFTKARNKYLVWRLKRGGGYTVVFDTDKVLRWDTDKVTWVGTDDFETWWAENLAGQGHGAYLHIDALMLERHEVRFSHPEDAALFKLVWS